LYRAWAVLQAEAYKRIAVTAVPTMIIGRQRLEGLYPAETMRQVIESELAHEATESSR
jgi:predicted DsbA family dithiol-disulfide isomerase